MLNDFHSRCALICILDHQTSVDKSDDGFEDTTCFSSFSDMVIAWTQPGPLTTYGSAPCSAPRTLTPIEQFLIKETASDQKPYVPKGSFVQESVQRHIC